jgi:nucleoside-diphosphate-sugar epimerase
MKSALIGHTGFVGGNLRAQMAFDDFYNTSNLESIAGHEYDLVVGAGAPAVKWLANKEPESDKASIARLMAALERVRARRFVLISTVDVYPRPVDVDEREELDLGQPQAYGRHRAELEAFVARRFPGATRVRLPGLFGPGLKKNVVYDFLNDNALDKVHQDGSFQFYDLGGLGQDLRAALDAGLEAVNFATEPVTTREVARAVFDREFVNALPPPAPRYDFRTRHAAAFGRRGPYLRTKAEVLAGMRAFVAAERARRPAQ